jgi:hypothetical protein
LSIYFHFDHARPQTAELSSGMALSFAA